MIGKILEKGINEQITAELWSSQLYLQMAFHFEKEGWSGFANWMYKQSVEEKEHACSMAKFLISRGGEVKLDKIDVVPAGWGSVMEVFKHVYKHECKVSELIEKLVDAASAEKDKAAKDFFMGFIREQVEEESSVCSIIDDLRHSGEANWCLVDCKLASR